MYGLKQAPRTWCERLSKFHLENSFSIGKVDTTLYIKHKNEDILIVQVYVNDIILVLLMSLYVKNFHLVLAKNLR